MIEPLEKRLVQEQSEAATDGSTFGGPGLPMSGKMESLQHQQDQTNESQEGEGKSEDSVPPPPIVMQTSLVQASKPKRYSSQRQKSGQSGEQQQGAYSPGLLQFVCIYCRTQDMVDLWQIK